MNQKYIVGISIVAVMIALGIADALTVEHHLLVDWREMSAQSQSSSSKIERSASSSSAWSEEPIEGIQKLPEPIVADVLAGLGFATQQSTETTLIEQIIPADQATVESRVLLKNNDRAGVIAWVDSPNVKVYFLALKEALHSTFSPEVHDLVDETQQREGKATRNLLTFQDPAISEERIVFVRIRERLYEFHVANGSDDVIFALVETLTN